jgi:hypothetical protein
MSVVKVCFFFIILPLSYVVNTPKGILVIIKFYKVFCTLNIVLILQYVVFKILTYDIINYTICIKLFASGILNPRPAEVC